MRERQMFKQADDGYWYVINNPAPAGSPAAEFWAQPFVLDKIDDTDGAYLLKANETLDREIMDTSYMHYK